MMSFPSKERKEQIKRLSASLVDKFSTHYKEFFPHKHSALYFFMSFIVACMLWLNVERHEEVDKTYSIGIAYENIPLGIKVIDFPTSFEVYLQGTEEDLKLFEEAYAEIGVIYNVDLSNITAGMNIFPVEIKKLEAITDRRAFRGLEILAVNPSHLVIVAEGVKKEMPEQNGSNKIKLENAELL